MYQKKFAEIPNQNRFLKMTDTSTAANQCFIFLLLQGQLTTELTDTQVISVLPPTHKSGIKERNSQLFKIVSRFESATSLSRPNITNSCNFISALLCGLSGFTEFIEQQLVDTIMSWSNTTTGCFHNPLEDYGNDCLNHMTSLGLTYEILLLSAMKM